MRNLGSSTYSFRRAARRMASGMAIRKRGLVFASAMFALVGAQAKADPPTQEALSMISWVARSGDNQGLPFMVIDKGGAEVFVFDRAGVFMGATPALVGSAKGDHEVLGVGDRELSNIKPSERTTPAGRFVARVGPR